MSKLRFSLLGFALFAVGCVMDSDPIVRMQAATILPQCSAKASAFESASAQVATKITTHYNQCQFPPDAGHIADPNPNKVPRELYDLEVPFGKSFNPVHLNAVLMASARSTWTYIQETFGVEVYAVPPVNYQNCQLFQELGYAPSNVRCVFDDHESALRISQGGSLQGLYWAAGYINESTQSYSHARAIIYVRADATRWTLVHEFMHHLFRDQRLLDGVPVYTPESSEDARNLVAAELERQQHQSTVREDQLRSLMNSANQMVQRGVGALLQNELEEAAIEYVLYKLYRQSLLTHTESNAMSSLQYIRMSVNRATVHTQVLLSLLEQIKYHFLNHGGTSAQLSQIESLASEVEQVSFHAEQLSQSLY